MASLDKGAEVDVLWWVGCAGAYDPRNQKVHEGHRQHPPRGRRRFRHPGRGRDLHRRFGPPRRQRVSVPAPLAQQNVETLNQYKFKLILTQCPHCLNTLLNEYPQFGGKYQVMHHTQYIEELLPRGTG